MACDPRQVLPAIERRLMRLPRRRVLANARWADDVPNLAGLYAIWDRKLRTIVYVGETSDLRSRFHDLRRAVNHTFTNKMREYLKLGARATDIQVARAMARRFELAFLAIPFGRSEAEEYLVLRYRKSLINKPAHRLLVGTQYNWVTPA